MKRLAKRAWLGYGLAGLFLLKTASATVYSGNPSNYRDQLSRLQPGDMLELAAGNYTRGLSISNMHGTADKRIVITGPESGAAAVFLGSLNGSRNTIQLDRASYITIRNLKLDGQNVPYIDGVNARNVTHHITIEKLLIVNHGGSYTPDTDHQLTVGINTKGPAWDWIIRRNIIIGAGTGIYLGNPNGTSPFVRGLIENNLIQDTLGYNMQIKHQNSRPADIGMPTGNNRTIIRHNVFSKASNGSSSGSWARPNLLVGHWPLSGAGSNDRYEIYGNFFYQNPTEALFQGEGNVALYNNVFINRSGSAVHIQQQKDRPRNIDVFFNTVVASGTGIKIRGVDNNSSQNLVANAVFAGRPFYLDSAVRRQANISDGYGAAANYLVNPLAEPGSLDAFPKANMLRGAAIDSSAINGFDDWNRDFNSRARDGSYRGAYAGEGQNPGWLPQLALKPDADTSNVAPSVDAGEGQSVSAGDAVVLSGSASDQDGYIATYSWRQISGTDVTLSDADTVTASFTAPAADTDTALVFQLTVTDNGGAEASDTVTVTLAGAANGDDGDTEAGNPDSASGASDNGDTGGSSSGIAAADAGGGAGAVGVPGLLALALLFLSPRRRAH